MEADTTYVYKALERPSQSIRLIKIVSITPHIHCEFRIAQLEDAPVFSALSYAWGVSAATEVIRVDEGSLSMISGLANAIRDVHGQWSQGLCTAHGDEQWLWADGICINQQDCAEKNAQVPLMDTIYSTAYQVISWLGPADIDVCAGIDTMNVLSNLVLQRSYYEEAVAWSSVGSVPTTKYIQDSNPNRENADLGWLQQHYKMEQGMKCPSTIFEHLLKTFWDPPHWQRLWILQELVLASKNVFLSGSKTTSWTAVCHAMFWLQHLRATLRVTDKPQNIPQEEWHLLERRPIPSVCATVAYLKYLWHHGKIRTSNPPVSHAVVPDAFDGTMVNRIQDGYRLYRDLDFYRVTHSKDYVYAIKALSGLDLHPDYSSSTTVAQVYQDFVAQWLCFIAKAASEGTVVDESFPLLWFLELAGVGSVWRNVPDLSDLPSWAPNFVGVANGASFRGRFVVPRDGQLKGLRRDPIFKIPRVDRSTLHCTAVFLDRVSKVSPRVCTIGPHGPGMEPERWLLWLFDLAGEALGGRPGADPIFMNTVRVLRWYAEDILQAHSVEEEVFRQLLIVDVAFAYHKLRGGIPAETFSRCFSGIGPTAASAFAEQLKGQLAGMDDFDRWNQLSSATVRGRLAGHDFTSAQLLAYCNTRDRLDNLCIAIAKSGHAGIFPPLVQVGDTICVLGGFPMPVVLREHKDGYLFVGSCVMKMWTEAVTVAPDDAKFVEIEIY